MEEKKYKFCQIDPNNCTVEELEEEVERLKKNVTKQEKVNESLTMKVNELISLENMQLVAAQEGLEYNNNNVIVIQK